MIDDTFALHRGRTPLLVRQNGCHLLGSRGKIDRERLADEHAHLPRLRAVPDHLDRQLVRRRLHAHEPGLRVGEPGEQAAAAAMLLGMATPAAAQLVNASAAALGTGEMTAASWAAITRATASVAIVL